MVARILLSFCLICCLLLTALAQQPTPAPTAKPLLALPQKPPEIDSQDVVKITTNLVQIDVSVTRGDKPVTDLRPEDFELFEDGKPQTITNFSYVSNMPGATTPRPDTTAKSKDKLATPVPPAKIKPGDQRRVLAVVVDDLGISWDSLNQVKTQLKKMI